MDARRLGRFTSPVVALTDQLINIIVPLFSPRWRYDRFTTPNKNGKPLSNTLIG